MIPFLSRLTWLPLVVAAFLPLAGCGSSEGSLPLAIGAQPGVDGAGTEVPTLDTSGSWHGKWFSSNDPATGLLANLVIAQSGNDFQGSLQVIGATLIQDTRPVVGTVFGNKLDADFDSGIDFADCFAEIQARHMDGTYQFRIPFQNEFGTFHLHVD